MLLYKFYVFFFLSVMIKKYISIALFSVLYFFYRKYCVELSHKDRQFYFWFIYRRFSYLKYDEEIFQLSLVIFFLWFVLCEKAKYIYFINDHILKCMSNNESTSHMLHL